jgi:hypothetical protein
VPGGTHCNNGAYGQGRADQRQQAPKAVHCCYKSVIAGPTEPPDDTAVRIVHGLQRAPRFADRIGVEAQIGEAAAARDLAQVHVVSGVDPADLGVKLLERLLQRGALLRFNAAFADSRGRESRRRTEKYRDHDD